ncbi:MAG: hypothetical protein J0I12_19315 [Candidatus Eremiobacteraeota bacterium]|nr:hypothetical protein [Candidatus Eremiobacteraeota bacterium]
MNPTTTVDNSTATRIRSEWDKVQAAVKDFAGSELNDPLGEDGQVHLVSKFFRHAGGGEVVLRKGSAPGDQRWTRFRAYGDTLEKSSYLLKENGVTEFHKRKVETGDKVTASDAPDADDSTWTGGLK